MADVEPGQLDLLLELQVTDHRVRKLRHQLDELPEQRQLEEVREQLTTIERERDDLLIELERLGGRQRQLEREIEVLTERRRAEQTRLYDGTVVNARELKAVEAEVEATERLIAEHEEQLLEVLEEVETLEGRENDLAAAADAGQRRTSELTQARDDGAKGLLAELAELESARDRQAGQLPDELLASYETAAERGGGTGVGELVGNACSACRIELSMADVGELYEGPPLTRCPQCRRLLVVPE